MPLIIVTGLPCSGKSRIAKQIRDYFIEHLEKKESQTRSSSRIKRKQVKLVTDGRKLNSEGRYTIYQNLNREKELRGWLKSETSRYVNQGHIVILDAACYIKGFRYELYCISKEAKTQHCVVECYPPVDVCKTRNQEDCDRQAERCYEEEPDDNEMEGKSSADDKDKDVDDEKDSNGYDDATFEALVKRYEKCNEKDRWDSPLYLVADAEAKDLDITKIFEFITKSNPLVPNKSTAPPTSQPLNFFQELESITTKVVEAILKHQKLTRSPSGVVTIPGTDKKYTYTKVMSNAELSRLKRQFIVYTKLHPIENGSNIADLFVQYLESI